LSDEFAPCYVLRDTDVHRVRNFVDHIAGLRAPWYNRSQTITLFLFPNNDTAR